VAERARCAGKASARVLAASFGAESGMVGAAVFARDRLGERVRA
jgi:hypothetical protein